MTQSEQQVHSGRGEAALICLHQLSHFCLRCGSTKARFRRPLSRLVIWCGKLTAHTPQRSESAQETCEKWESVDTSQTSPAPLPSASTTKASPPLSCSL